MASLAVSLNRLSLANPILVASGTFGYAREMEAFVDFSRLGGIIPKTITPFPRRGNPPPRTVETPSGMLNSIGLDNDGIAQYRFELADPRLVVPLLVLGDRNSTRLNSIHTDISRMPSSA